jgi:hypothetical protein
LSAFACALQAPPLSCSCASPSLTFRFWLSCSTPSECISSVLLERRLTLMSLAGSFPGRPSCCATKLWPGRLIFLENSDWCWCIIDVPAGASLRRLRNRSGGKDISRPSSNWVCCNYWWWY